MKVLFFDIDGTLVDERKQNLPESARQGLRQAHRNGHLLFINTGRCQSFMPFCLEGIPWDGFVYGCGSHIEYRGKTLLKAYVDQRELVYIRDAMDMARIQGVFQGPEYSYFSQEIVPYNNFKAFLTLYDRDYKRERKSFYEEGMEVNKIVTFRTESSDYATFMKKMGNYQIIENGGGFMELLPLAYTKATGMDFVTDYFGLDKKDCYAFGDSPNDLPMLMNTENSIAMGNGYESVKKISAYVTDDIDKDGLYKALKHYRLI